LPLSGIKKFDRYSKDRSFRGHHLKKRMLKE
jgi:hypothetical protein